jgi:hypothetical protein
VHYSSGLVPIRAPPIVSGVGVDIRVYPTERFQHGNGMRTRSSASLRKPDRSGRPDLLPYSFPPSGSGTGTACGRAAARPYEKPGFSAAHLRAYASEPSATSEESLTGCEEMYICQICKTCVPAKTPATRVTVATRYRHYPQRPKAHPVKRKGKIELVDDPGGEGYEIAHEVLACPTCAARHQAQAAGADHAAVATGGDTAIPSSHGTHEP